MNNRIKYTNFVEVDDSRLKLNSFDGTLYTEDDSMFCGNIRDVMKCVNLLSVIGFDLSYIYVTCYIYHPTGCRFIVVYSPSHYICIVCGFHYSVCFMYPLCSFVLKSSESSALSVVF